MELPRKFVQQSFSLEKRRSLRLQAESRSLAAWCQSQHRTAIALAVCVCATAMIVCSPKTLFAQTPPAPPAPAAPAESDGVTRGGYQIHQSIELGYRSTDTTGSGDMYDTLGNLPRGPRLLEQRLKYT